MCQHCDKIITDLGDISASLVEIKVTLAEQSKDIERNADDLAEHMRRTKLLEDRMLPVEGHIQRWAGVGKFVSITATLAGIAAAAFQILKGI